MSEEIQVVAIFHPTLGKEKRLKEVLIDLARNVHQNEKGVTKYQVFEQYDSQTGANVFLFQETYSNKSTVDTHLATPHFTAMADLLPKEGLISKPFEIIAIKPIGGFASR